MLYAAYATSLDPSRIAQIAPHSPPRGTGWLEGWRLTFGGEDLGWDGALGTVVEDPDSRVFIALYDITEADERALDAWEGVSLGLWRKIRVRVETMNRQQLAWLYVLDAYEGGLPSAHYLGVIADAAERGGAPADYVADLRSRPCKAVVTSQPPGVFDDPAAIARQAAADLVRLTGIAQHDVVIVLGSGWAPAADLLGAATREFPTSQLAGFAPPMVSGHAGTIRSIEVHGKRCLVFLGRTHLYEGRGVEPVVHPVRTAAAAGCRTLILTNGCGSLRSEWKPGTPVLISDHINLTGSTPLRGAAFLDMTDLYSARVRALCRQIDPTLPEGVYVQLHGPQYETPAEVRMVRAIGGDLVGMSTALEAIAAREAGLEVLGISLATNLAAGMTAQPLHHEEVLAAGRAAAQQMGRLLAEVVAAL